MFLNTGKSYFLVLIPHRDTRLLMLTWSASVFNSCPGSWSFPWVIPIARLTRALKGKDLKQLGIILRNDIDKAGGKIFSIKDACIEFPIFSTGKTFLYGKVLNLEPSIDFYPFIGKKHSCLLKPLILGTALTDRSACSFPCLPEICFRACALANMEISPLASQGILQNNFSIEWRIGPLFWLPKFIKT